MICLISTPEQSRLNNSQVNGFTLLEVLIAMAVLALALMALSGSMNQAIKNQIHHKDTTLAHYVAMYHLGDMKLEEPFPDLGTTRGDIVMLNREWRWTQSVLKTTEENLRRIEVSVARKEEPDYQLSKIIAFAGNPEQSASQRGGQRSNQDGTQRGGTQNRRPATGNNNGTRR